MGRAAHDKEAQVAKSNSGGNKGFERLGEPVATSGPISNEELKSRSDAEDKAQEQRPEVVESNPV